MALLALVAVFVGDATAIALRWRRRSARRASANDRGPEDDRAAEGAALSPSPALS